MIINSNYFKQIEESYIYKVKYFSSNSKSLITGEENHEYLTYSWYF